MISVVIITNNEQDELDNCLKWLSWCDDIIIIDNNSLHKTIDIARKYTNRIFNRKFDTFSAQRNYGIEKAKYNWILSLDPDETLTEELSDEILEEIKLDKYSAYYIPFKHHFFGKWLKYGGWYPSYLKRLFRKDKAIWKNDVHEILKVDGEVGYLKNPVLHYGHKDIFMFIAKMNKYTNIEADARRKKNEKDNIFTMIFASLKTFLNRYIRMLGFLDGAHGFVVSIFAGFYVFLAKAKNWEYFYKKKVGWNFER